MKHTNPPKNSRPARRTSVALSVLGALALLTVGAPSVTADEGDCNVTNYGNYFMVGDYNCESDHHNNVQRCEQGAGAGAGAGAGGPGGNKAGADASAGTSCEQSGGHMDSVSEDEDLFDQIKANFAYIIDWLDGLDGQRKD